jgi:hypothetical protein
MRFFYCPDVVMVSSRGHGALSEIERSDFNIELRRRGCWHPDCSIAVGGANEEMVFLVKSAPGEIL